MTLCVWRDLPPPFQRPIQTPAPILIVLASAGFVGVWNIRDRGDAPPHAIIKGPYSQLLHPTGLALNVKNGELYVTDSIRNGLFTYLVPELF
jgi:NHL repeat